MEIFYIVVIPVQGLTLLMAYLIMKEYRESIHYLAKYIQILEERAVIRKQ